MTDLVLDFIPRSALDTDAALAANSDAKVATQKAVKGYVDTASGLLIPKSLIDAKGDLIVGTADNTPARKAAGSNGEVLAADSAQSDGLAYTKVKAANVDTTLKPSGSAASGDEALRALGSGATQAAAGDDSRFPTSGQKNALAGTSGTPGSGNPYVTDGDSRNANTRTPSANSVALSTIPAATIDAILPWRIDIAPFIGTIAMTGALSTSPLATSFYGGLVYNTAGAQNDEYGWDVILAAGTWSLYLIGQQASFAAISTALIDGQSVGTNDWYNASTTNNNIKSITGISVASTAKKRLSLKAATRNASNSSSYSLLIQGIALVRTA